MPAVELVAARLSHVEAAVPTASGVGDPVHTVSLGPAM
jgi:hypothetical protein